MVVIMKTLLAIVILFFTSTACAQCFKLVETQCLDDPIFATKVIGNTVALVAVMPEDVESVSIFWGDRLRTEAAIPLPSIYVHTYENSFVHSIRLQSTTEDGSVVNYTRDEVPDFLVSIEE